MINAILDAIGYVLLALSPFIAVAAVVGIGALLNPKRR